jgi:hypothetical protein
MGVDKDHYFYHYLKVHVKGENVRIEVQPVSSPDYECFDRLGFIGWLYISPFFRFHGIEIALALMAAGLLVLVWRAREK